MEYDWVKQYQEFHDTRGFLRNWQNPAWHVQIFDFSSYLQGVTDSLGHPVIDISGVKPNIVPTLLSHLPEPPADVIDDLAVWAKEKLTEVCDPAADLWNFVKELAASIIGIVQILRKCITKEKSFRSNLLTAILKLIDKSGLKIDPKRRQDLPYLWSLLSPAQRFLIVSFVILPFLKDLQAILNAYNESLRKLKWLQKHNGKPVRNYVGRENVWQPGEAIEFSVDFPLSHLCSENVGGGPGHAMETVSTSVVCRLVEYELTFKAQAWMVFEIPPGLLEGLPGRLRVWAHMMGLDNPIGFLWEGLRFSWLVDWFLSYRARLFQRLSSLGNEGFKPAVILDSGHSWKVKTNWQVIQQVHHVGPSGTFTNELDLGHVELKLYSRMLGLPDSQAYYIRSPISWEHFVLLWAVIEQKILNRFRRK
jgi:hypothetical protein